VLALEKLVSSGNVRNGSMTITHKSEPADTRDAQGKRMNDVLSPQCCTLASLVDINLQT